ncbi:hypothetical protein B0T20DRAFT_404497 [Sordaria brevicollis]|uniref:Uncharacterized protein n=1 Tax=Sordaria brevicollis TaxID=83679 RepID=A0AAE0PI48_SORBR|nr:hypothetical protein B0T20DRAFT_404497 [Sordaria brevicollis]
MVVIFSCSIMYLFVVSVHSSYSRGKQFNRRSSRTDIRAPWSRESRLDISFTSFCDQGRKGSSLQGLEAIEKRVKVDPRGELHFAGQRSNLGLGPASLFFLRPVCGASARADGLQWQLKW